jgi:peptide deformylase
MAVLDVLHIPDPFLRLVSKPVEFITPEHISFLQDMFDTMKAEDGIGLAAPQVGRLERMIIMDIEDITHGCLFMINPEIISKSEEKQVYQEGCLSVPGEYSDVHRSSQITYTYQNIQGQIITAEAGGILSVCIQHEIDHLNGVLFVDYLPPMKRTMIHRRIHKKNRSKM